VPSTKIRKLTMPADIVFMTWFFLLCAIAIVMSWLLRRWINKAESPEARPRHAAFAATVFPWACVACQSNRVDSWFLIDSRTRQPAVFFSEESLRLAAEAEGFKLALKPISEIYAEHRWTIFDDLMKYVLFIPPQIAFGLLLWWLRALRAGARPVQSLSFET
jgi:hypothetical protein